MQKKNIEKIYQASDSLCTALQIINHIQDCKKDFKELNRVYIPESFFKKYSLNNSLYFCFCSSLRFFLNFPNV